MNTKNLMIITISMISTLFAATFMWLYLVNEYVASLNSHSAGYATNANVSFFVRFSELLQSSEDNSGEFIDGQSQPDVSAETQLFQLNVVDVDERRADGSVSFARVIPRISSAVSNLKLPSAQLNVVDMDERRADGSVSSAIPMQREDAAIKNPIKETMVSPQTVAVVNPEDKSAGESAISRPILPSVMYLNTFGDAAANMLEGVNKLRLNIEAGMGRGSNLITKDVPGLYIPILTYHNFVDNPDDVTDLSVEIAKFRRDLEIFIENGYTTLLFQDIINYIHMGVPLPGKPLLITMDDGYMSNYSLAYPVLKELNAKATIFIIGETVGVVPPPDDKTAFAPHFNMEQAREMLSSGLIDIQSHSYGLHENTYGGADRDGATRRADESSEEYINKLKSDDAKMQRMFEAELDRRAYVFSYPYGQADRFSEELLSNLGYKATVFSGNNQFTHILYGFPRSLNGLNRLSVRNDMPAEEIIEFIEGFTRNERGD